MGNCSGGCGGCKPKSTCNDSCDKDSCGTDSCCGDGSCNCDAKYAKAYNQAIENNGIICYLCGKFSMYAVPNRCDGLHICYNCRTTRSWQIPKGKWKN